MDVFVVAAVASFPLRALIPYHTIAAWFLCFLEKKTKNKLKRSEKNRSCMFESFFLLSSIAAATALNSKFKSIFTHTQKVEVKSRLVDVLFIEISPLTA